MSINKLGKDTKVELEHFKKHVSIKKALEQTQQEANTHTCATQELISAKLAVQAQSQATC